MNSPENYKEIVVQYLIESEYKRNIVSYLLAAK